MASARSIAPSSPASACGQTSAQQGVEPIVLELAEVGDAADAPAAQGGHDRLVGSAAVRIAEPRGDRLERQASAAELDGSALALSGGGTADARRRGRTPLLAVRIAHLGGRVSHARTGEDDFSLLCVSPPPSAGRGGPPSRPPVY